MVIDTNVFVYALLRETEVHEEARLVFRARDEVIVPNSLKAELVNVVWQWIRVRQLAFDLAISVLGSTQRLIDREVATELLWERALQFAVQADHSPYDTLFAALAEREATRVVTYDERFRRAFPDLTISPADFLAS
jgi:predicted nucleic acid-binding protein